jgi:hypothetical protein
MARAMHIVRVPDAARTAFLRACDRLPEFLDNFLVGQSLAEQGEDIALPWRESRLRGEPGDHSRRGRAGPEVVNEAARHMGCQRGPAAAHHPDCRHQLLYVSVLEEQAVRAAPQHLQRKIDIGGRRQPDHLGGRSRQLRGGHDDLVDIRAEYLKIDEHHARR